MTVRRLDTSELGPIRSLPPDQRDWRTPYRSMDAGGSPDSASAVAWAWIDALAMKLRDEGRRNLSIDSTRLDGDGGTVQLWDGVVLLAVATLFRDPMNFAVLVRWAAKGVV